MFRNVLIGAGVFVAVVAVLFILGNVGLGFQAYFKPKEVAIERKTFEQSQPHVEGMIRDLSNFYREYNDPNATETQKAVIKATIQHQFANISVSEVPDYLKGFYNQMMGY